MLLRLSVRADAPFWKKVERAYELWEQRADIDTNPTLDEAFVLWKILKEEGLVKRGGDNITRRTVRSWFLNRRTYSPYVDEVAVRRAMRWDAGVWDTMTYREQATAYDRLDGPPADDHPEYDAWLAMPSEVRNRVIKGLEHRRRRAA